MPDFLWLALLPLATLAAAIGCWRALRNGLRRTPFLTAVAMFLLAYVGLVISNVPYLVPPTLDVWQAAADPKSQAFALVGTLILLPVVLGYTAFNYWIFRGRNRAGAGYH